MKPNDPTADRAYLEHIRDSAVTIAGYLHDIDEEKFRNQQIYQDAVIRQLLIIGEATKRLSPAIRSQHPAIPWQDIAGMRDKLVHDYFGVDTDAVWLAATEDVPELLDCVHGLLGRG